MQSRKLQNDVSTSSWRKWVRMAAMCTSGWGNKPYRRAAATGWEKAVMCWGLLQWFSAGSVYLTQKAKMNKEIVSMKRMFLVIPALPSCKRRWHYQPKLCSASQVIWDNCIKGHKICELFCQKEEVMSAWGGTLRLTSLMRVTVRQFCGILTEIFISN